MIVLALAVALVAIAAHVILARAQAQEIARWRSLATPPARPAAEQEPAALTEIANLTRPPTVVTARHRASQGTRTLTVPPVLLCLALAVLAGCPRLPPTSGCAPLSSRCEGDRPQVCSPSQRWHTTGDERCDATPGQACKVSAQGVAGCAR